MHASSLAQRRATMAAPSAAAAARATPARLAAGAASARVAASRPAPAPTIFLRRGDALVVAAKKKKKAKSAESAVETAVADVVDEPVAAEVADESPPPPPVAAEEEAPLPAAPAAPVALETEESEATKPPKTSSSLYPPEGGGITADGLDDLQAQLAALMSENNALLNKIDVVSADKADAEAVIASPGITIPTAPKRGPIGPDDLLTPPDVTSVEWPSPNDATPFYKRPPVRMPELIDPHVPPRTEQPLHVVHVTAEMAPLAKVGGLGDVVTGLARAHSLAGHNVEVVLPFYSSLAPSDIENLTHVMDFGVPKGREKEWDGVKTMENFTVQTAMYTGKIDGCDVILLKPASTENSNIFVGNKIYGGSYNELEAYLYFCRASLEMLRATGRDPNVIHVHEWQCSAVAMLYWDVYHAEGMLHNAKVMLTIHNMDNTGECRQEEFIATGVQGESFNTLEKAMDERTIGHNPERMCLLKGAIVYSNFVTTVSPTYAADALRGGGGFLAKTLMASRGKFMGVLNGVDEKLWDARLDPYLPASFAPGRMEGKAICKRYLQEGLGLEVSDEKPLVVCVSRLVPQKGIHLIDHAIKRTKAQGGQFVLLGSGHSDPPFQAMAENEFKDDPDVRLLIFYSDPLSHLMYAAADMVLVPSMFEPCGLTQMIAMEYGALPVVRKTGGLADTVFDVDDGSIPEERKNGFVFEGGDERSLDDALDRGIEYCQERKEWWASMQEKVMKSDNSWERAGAEYERLYRAMQSAM